MGKSVSNAVLDGELDIIAACDQIDVVTDTATPTDLTGSIASVALDAGDFTKADGDSSGRKITVAQQTDISVTSGGTAKHVVLSDGGVIQLITTCADKVLESGDKVTVPAFKYEAADPT